MAQKQCNTDEYFQKSLTENSRLQALVDAYLERLKNYLTNHPYHPNLHRNAVTIPVVVHILHQTTAQNITDAQVRSQITALNNDYRKRNTTEIRNNLPADFSGKPVDTYIQFELARRDTAGRRTNGIVRYSTTETDFRYGRNKEKRRSTGGADAWDPSRYLNMWICDLKDTDNAGNQTDDLLGYATFPWDKDAIPGVVMDYKYFGTTGTATAPFNLGRTTTHEVGHFLGLWHIWYSSGCGRDDDVADTPKQDSNYRGTPSHPQNSCGSDDMFMNYMDYTDDNAMYMFTAGQRDRMLGNLAPNGRWASLAVSNALFPPNATDRTYTVYLEAEARNFPAWKASLAMVYGWAAQECPDIDALVQQNAGNSRLRINGMPNEIAEVVNVLAMDVEELTSCINIQRFYDMLNRGPVALLSVKNTEYFGLVVNGMTVNNSQGKAWLNINDPMNVGPRNFGVTQTGATYNVEYAEFMTQALNRAVSGGSRIFVVYPPGNPF